ncbi:PREDICTED: vinexin [Nanorana parkeri]|uniref:vinexin n=1 Tax=Nanorana parkeri TaxID=125878 RepID=UPI000854792F|nr:PREDICTED: vinexin [Nanorana parkeri]
MALQWMAKDLPLSLDDFIPRHLQRKDRSTHRYTEDQGISDDDGHLYKATMVVTSEDTCDSPSPRTQRRLIRYEGIGPTDEDGMPFASRSSVDKPREWYKNMFRVLHPLSDAEDSDSEGSIQAEDKSQSRYVTSVSGYINKEQDSEPEQDDQPRRSKESNHLHITLKPTVSESPRKLSSPSKVETSVGPSSSFRSTGHSHFSLNKSAEEQRSPPSKSIEPQFTRRSTGTYSTVSTSKQPQQTQATHHHKYQPSPELASPNSVSSSRLSYRSRVSDFPNTPSLNASKGTSSPKSPHDKDKHPSFRANSSVVSTLRSTSRDSRKNGTKVLDQLETELREFTEELDRDMKARKRTESLEVCEEVILRRSSYREDGSAESNLNSTQSSRSNTDDNQALSPVAQAVVKFDFVAQSEKEISLERGSTVHILKPVDKNWFLGEQNGRRGMFPGSYVKVISPDQHDGADTPQLSAIALYDFKADSDVELPLRKDSNGVTLREKPRIVKAPASNKLQQLQGTVYRAVFPFSPNNSDELQLVAGDVVTVTQQCDDGWFVGVCWRTQQFGTFPGNYVVPYVTS